MKGKPHPPCRADITKYTPKSRIPHSILYINKKGILFCLSRTWMAVTLLLKKYLQESVEHMKYFPEAAWANDLKNSLFSPPSSTAPSPTNVTYYDGASL